MSTTHLDLHPQGFAQAGADDPKSKMSTITLEGAQTSADALFISERRCRRLFETARDGILILDNAQGTITDANPYMTELLGYSHDELVGKDLWEIGLLQNKEASQEAFLQLKQDGHIRYDTLPLQTRSGEEREVKFISSVYVEADRSVVQCNIRDITERKRIERALAAVLAREHKIAETLQRSMLQVAPAGKFAGIEVETLYAAALNEADVGGDFHDAFALAGGKVALVVGDVSGKGLLAAGRTAEVKYALRAFLHEYQDPAIALGRLNEFICETHRLDEQNTEAFIVLALAVVDPTLGLATFSAAGAEPSLVLRANGTVELVETIGCPLGIQPGGTYCITTLALEPGATVVMATDGITEARRGSDFLGLEGMTAIVEGNGPGTTLARMTQAIYGGARDFAGGALRDDVCVLVARRSPAA